MKFRSNSKHAAFLVAAGIVAFTFPRPLLAQTDRLSLGQGPGCVSAAAGNTVVIPLFISDFSGTPLGMDRPANERIQSLSIKVTYSPASAVKSVNLVKAGILASLEPRFQIQPKTATSVSYVAVFPGTGSAIPFTLNPAGRGDLVAEITLVLAADASPGTQVQLIVESPESVTLLGNETGTIAESVTRGTLVLDHACVVVSGTPPSTPSRKRGARRAPF